MKRLLVIGGGLAGLNAAYQAQRAGAEVRVLEASDRPGGVVQSAARRWIFIRNRAEHACSIAIRPCSN